jgi:hypothetical protein
MRKCANISPKMRRPLVIYFLFFQCTLLLIPSRLPHAYPPSIVSGPDVIVPHYFASSFFFSLSHILPQFYHPFLPSNLRQIYIVPHSYPSPLQSFIIRTVYPPHFVLPDLTSFFLEIYCFSFISCLGFIVPQSYLSSILTSW